MLMQQFFFLKIVFYFNKDILVTFLSDIFTTVVSLIMATMPVQINVLLQIPNFNRINDNWASKDVVEDQIDNFFANLPKQLNGEDGTEGSDGNTGSRRQNGGNNNRAPVEQLAPGKG